MSTFSNTSLALGLILAGGLGMSASAFSMNDLSQGYTLAAADQVKAPTEGKCGEGKCGEGKCGEDRSGKAGSHADGQAAKNAEGKCGEGKCGEGKCGTTTKP